MLFDDLELASMAEGMFGCSALGGTEHEITNKDGVASGIISGHAYSITDVIILRGDLMKELVLYDEEGEQLEPDVIKPVRLLRLRNPWGNFLHHSLLIFHR